MYSGLVLLAVALLLLPGCSRHRDQKATQAKRDSTPIASAPPVATPPPDPIAAAAPAPPPADPAAAVRPSPFADQKQLAAAPTAPPAANRVKAAPKTKEEPKAPRPFVPSSTNTPRDRVAAFPAPPPLSANAHAPAAGLPAPKTCCYGTATSEPARPARLQRMLQRVPGIRRIRQTPDTTEGYVAPRPAHEINMVLPPETRKMLVEGTMDLKASVNEAGRVTRVQLIAPKDEELVRLAAYAASTWPFVPAKVNDKAVAGEVILHFSFNIN